MQGGQGAGGEGAGGEEGAVRSFGRHVNSIESRTSEVPWHGGPLVTPSVRVIS